MAAGTGWRDALGRASVAQALDEVTGETPAALWAKDYHSLWLNSAGLRTRDGDLDVPGGVVERDGAGEPTGILREESAWRFRERWVDGLGGRVGRGHPRGDQGRERTRRRRDPRQGRLARRDSIFARIHEHDGLDAARLAVAPADGVGELAALGMRSAARRRLPAARLSEGVHGRDARLADRAGCSTGAACVITSGEELAEIVRRRPAAGWPVAVHAIGDRANREALDAFEATRDLWQPLGLRHRIEHAQCLDPADVGRFAELGVACSVQFSHAPSDRDLAERFWGERLDGTYAFRSLMETRARSSRTARTRPSRSSTRSPGSGGRAPDDRRPPAWRPEESVTVEQALHATTVAPAWLAGDERAAGRCSRLARGSRGARPRPVACQPEELDVGGGGRDHGRRPLGAQPATLGLSGVGSPTPSAVLLHFGHGYAGRADPHDAARPRGRRRARSRR